MCTISITGSQEFRYLVANHNLVAFVFPEYLNALPYQKFKTTFPNIYWVSLANLNSERINILGGIRLQEFGLRVEAKLLVKRT